MLKLFNNIYKINKNFLLNFYVFDFNKKYNIGFVYKKKCKVCILLKNLFYVFI